MLHDLLLRMRPRFIEHYSTYRCAEPAQRSSDGAVLRRAPWRMVVPAEFVSSTEATDELKVAEARREQTLILKEDGAAAQRELLLVADRVLLPVGDKRHEEGRRICPMQLTREGPHESESSAKRRLRQLPGWGDPTREKVLT